MARASDIRYRLRAYREGRFLESFRRIVAQGYRVGWLWDRFRSEGACFFVNHGHRADWLFSASEGWFVWPIDLRRRRVSRGTFEIRFVF